MKPKKDIVLIRIGAFLILYWFIDFINNAVLTNDYSWLLWYSSMGLLATGIALIFQQGAVISSLFCALFVVESMWIVDFIYTITHRRVLIGFSQYILSPSFHAKDMFLTLYHILIPLCLFIAVYRIKKSYPYSWIGAIIYATTVFFLTYFLTGPTSQVNCIHSTDGCRSAYSFLYQIENPQRIIVVILIQTILIFIPTNYVLMRVKKD